MPEKASHEPRAKDEEDRVRFRWRETPALLRATAHEFIEDKVPKQAAALAYYTLFAIGPLMVLALGLAALAFGADASRAAVMGQLSRMLGVSGADAVAQLITGADRERAGLLATIVGGIVLLISAGAVFAQLKEALNRIWEVEAKAALGWKAKIVRAVRKNLLSFVGVIGTGFLLLVSLLLSAGVAAATNGLGRAFPAAAFLAPTASALVMLALVWAIFAAMFKLLPDARVAWHDVFVGAFVTALLFVVGQIALGYYLGAGPLASRYGAAGAVLIVLVWVYYSGIIAFFGAEFTQVYANRYGSRVRASKDARPLVEAVTEEQAPPEQEGTRAGGKPRSHA